MNEPRRLSALHMPGLDGIRGLAILLVIPHNANLMAGTAFHGFAYLIKEVVLFGWAGVQLFFVLSGFLITGFLLDTQRSANFFSSFYARRALRILPLYYGVLVVTFLVLAPLGWLPRGTLTSAHHQIWLWTFLSNWTGGFGGDVAGFAHYWSLAVEEQFYLLWPLLVHRVRPRQVAALGLGVSVAALAIRVAMRAAGASSDYLYEFTICRMDALAMGAAAAAMLRVPAWRERLAALLSRLTWIALLLLVAGAFATHDYSRTGAASETFGQTLLGLAFTAWVLAASQAPGLPPTWMSRALSIAPLRSLGKYSYGMYVFHYPLHEWLGVRLIRAAAIVPSAANAVLYSAAVILASYAVAWCSYHAYERHFLELKRHFAPEPAADAHGSDGRPSRPAGRLSIPLLLRSRRLK